MSIGKRILFGFVALSLMIVALGIYALSEIGTVSDATDAIVTRDLATLRQLDDLGNRARQLGLLRRNAVIAALTRAQGRSASSEHYHDEWKQVAGQIDAVFADLLPRTKSYADSALTNQRGDAWSRLNAVLGEAASAFRQVRTDSEAQFALVATNDVSAIEAKNTELSRDNEAFTQSIDSARQVLDSAIALGQRSVRDIYNRSRISIFLTLLAAVVLAIIVNVMVNRAVVRPLDEVMAFVDNVGAGDLTGRVGLAGNDAFAKLGTTLNGMVAGLSDMARSNRTTTSDLNAAAAEIRAAAQQQAASVEEQFAAVQETAATVDQITHSGAQIGKRATEVIATAQSTAQTAKAGLRAAADAAKAMDLIREQGEAVAGNIVALSEKTQAIGEIIATVNDVSERTHLLALNAAIEAAAAGESGRSFAVVASEMKLLADQAKTATGQVRALLSEIQRGINSSVMLTEEAVKRAATGKSRSDSTVRTIEEMAARAEENLHTFQQIVASTNQQQLGIEQVMGALQNIRQASQQTAAGTREVETATANVTELAQALMALADRYRV